ncbi:hypothetical protein [Nocardia xishanensis]
MGSNDFAVPHPRSGVRRIEDSREEFELVGQGPPLPWTLVDVEVVDRVFAELRELCKPSERSREPRQMAPPAL